MVRIKAFFSKTARLAMRFTFTLFLISLASVLFLRFIPPVASAFMVGKYCEGLFASSNRTSIRYHWVDRQHISPHMALAVVAAEDQKFPEHFGFDFRSMVDALKERGNGGSLRGASTITQQVAKNLFLWKGKNFIRKGLEAYFTMLMEVLWPKRRILEVYLNIAEFGDGIYGVEAAANRFFHKPPARLTKRESALLSAVLPNPIRLRAAAPSAYVRQRAQKIEKQMRNLGSSYLKGIWSAS